MAHQDYVAKAGNKKNNPYKKKQEVKPSVFTLKMKLISLFTLIAVGLFSYFLWSIKDKQAPEQTAPSQQDTQLPRSQSNIPAFNKKEYDVMHQLQNKEVKGGEYEVADLGEFGLYCASFREYERADKLKAQIAFAGVISKIKTKKGANGTWHQVYIGPYPNKRAAEADKHKLNRNKLPTCSIRSWK